MRFSETEKYFATCLSLPLFPDMDESVFQYVVETFLSLLDSEALPQTD